MSIINCKIILGILYYIGNEVEIMYSEIIKVEMIKLRNKIAEVEQLVDNRIENVIEDKKHILVRLKNEIIISFKKMAYELETNVIENQTNKNIDEHVIAVADKLINAIDQTIIKIENIPLKQTTTASTLTKELIDSCLTDKKPEEIDRELGFEQKITTELNNEDEEISRVKKVVLDMFMNEYDDISYIIDEVRKMTELINKTIEEHLNNPDFKDNAQVAKDAAIMICEKSLEHLKAKLLK